MFTQLFRNWWTYMVRGVMAIIFGTLALIWPDQVKLFLVLLFGTFALLDGIFAIIISIASRRYFARWWAVLLEGVAGILIGLLTFFWPNVTGLALLYLIAAWATITGTFEIVAAIEFRNLIPGEWATFLSGLLSIVFGILLFVYPSAGAISLIWVIGIYAIAFGILEIVFASRLHSLLRELDKTVVSAA